MKLWLMCCAILFVVSPTIVAGAPQESDSTLQQSICTFEDGKGLRIQYAASNDKPVNGKVWTPGNKGLSLFTDTEITIGNTTLPIGAYGLYVIPGKQNWTLLVSRDMKSATDFKESEVVAKISMETGDMGHDVESKVSVGRLQPKVCAVRVYAGHFMAWGEIHQK